MASFSSLPPEIVYHIISLSLEPVAHPGTPRRRHSPLLSLSLVARAWVYPCQSLLWRDTHLTKSSAAQQWLQVPLAARFSTRSMRIDGESLWDEGIRSDEMRELLQASQGLPTLIICGVRPLDPAAFSLPSLQDLTILVFENLHKVFLHPVVPSFHLTTLCLQSASLPSSLFDSLLLASSTTLINLFISYPLVMSPSSPLTLIAPRLQHLHLGKSCDSFLPLIPLCTSLLRLSLGAQETHPLPDLPLSLHTLALDMKDPSFLLALSTLTIQLDRESRGMSLKKVEMREDMRDSFTEDSWQALKETFGVEAVFREHEESVPSFLEDSEALRRL